MSKIKIALLRMAFAIVVLAMWEFASGRWIGAMYISAPSAIAKKLYLMVADGTLFFHMSFTAFEAGLGFLCGGTAGFVVGLVLGRAKTASEVLDPFIMGFYSLPKIAMAPLFVMWFGIGIGMKVVFVSMVCFLLVFLNTYSGVRSVSRELVTIFKLMGAGEASVTQLVVVPSALTWVFAGLRLSIPYALVAAIIGELIAGNRGLGYLVENAASQFDTASSFAVIFSITLLAIAVNALVKFAERKLMPWRQVDEMREMAV